MTGVDFLHDGRELGVHGDAVLLATGGAGHSSPRPPTPPSPPPTDWPSPGGPAPPWPTSSSSSSIPPAWSGPPPRETGNNEAEINTDPLLISEAVRGEGAILVDAHGERFMPAYHPDAELAPRDVVSRSIALHLAALGDPNGHVFLDARVIEASRGNGFLAQRFPTLSARTREAGIDWTREPVPVAPAAHYWMGGVVTDLHGRTSVPGLLAAGEVACTGVQGANRLASNSLLEGLVFGRRAVAAFLRDDVGGVPPDAVPPLAVSAAGGLPLTLAAGTPSGDDRQLHWVATDR